MSFGEKLKICRVARGLTQPELANLVGSTKQVISLYEKGERIPKVVAAAKYAAVLDVPVNYLVNDYINMRLWESDDLLEDYWHASPPDKLKIVTRRGIDPRIASDYEKISALARFADAEKTAAPAANVVIARGRDGSFVEKKLSDEDLAALQRFIDCLPEKTDL